MLYGQWIWSRVANARQLRVPARGFWGLFSGIWRFGHHECTNFLVFWRLAFDKFQNRGTRANAPARAYSPTATKTCMNTGNYRSFYRLGEVGNTPF